MTQNGHYLNKGDRVRVVGLTGEAKVLDRWNNPGEMDATVKLAFIRPRSGKVSAVKNEMEKNCIKL